jgi:hypothetical protein
MEPTPLARSRVPACAAHLNRWADKIEIQDNKTKETKSLPFGVGLP